ncbi:MAG: ATP-binding protein [Kofleriaceae bacterium]
MSSMPPPPPLTSFVEFDRIPVIGLLLELDGTVVAANEAMCRLIAKPADQIVGRKLEDFSRKNSVHTQHQQHTTIDELELDGPEGPVTLEVVMSIIRAGCRDLLQLFGIDVTARKNAELVAKARAVMERQTSARQRNEALGIVAGGIAHDFNNLLVGVLAEASAAREDPSLPPQTLEALRRIESGARKMSQLTRSMLAYAGRGRVDNKRLDPDGLLYEMAESLRAICSERTLVLNASAGSCAIDADSNLLRQMLANIVQNASEAKGTRVEVTSRIVMRQNSAWWQLEVGDDGEGIEPNALPHIFEPFYTTRPDQTGLGLSAVQGIVRRLGGDIEVDSLPRQGSRFRVRLPVLEGVEAPARPTQTQSNATARLAGLRVLIADDEPSVRTTVRRLLERRGANVEVAVDGSDAEQKLDASFGLVILDVSMPGRTGYDVLATARRRYPEMPVLLMSGYTELKRGAGGEEPDGFLEKPFTARALDTLIDEVMGARSR